MTAFLTILGAACGLAAVIVAMGRFVERIREQERARAQVARQDDFVRLEGALSLAQAQLKQEQAEHLLRVATMTGELKEARRAGLQAYSDGDSLFTAMRQRDEAIDELRAAQDACKALRAEVDELEKNRDLLARRSRELDSLLTQARRERDQTEKAAETTITDLRRQLQQVPCAVSHPLDVSVKWGPEIKDSDGSCLQEHPDGRITMNGTVIGTIIGPNGDRSEISAQVSVGSENLGNGQVHRIDPPPMTAEEAHQAWQELMVKTKTQHVRLDVPVSPEAGLSSAVSFGAADADPNLLSGCLSIGAVNNPMDHVMHILRIIGSYKTGCGFDTIAREGRFTGDLRGTLHKLVENGLVSFLAHLDLFAITPAGRAKLAGWRP